MCFIIIFRVDLIYKLEIKPKGTMSFSYFQALHRFDFPRRFVLIQRSFESVPESKFPKLAEIQTDSKGREERSKR